MAANNTRSAMNRPRRPESQFSRQRGHICPLSMKEPMPFIVTTADGKMQVNRQIEEILAKAVEPISVIAIAGKYRTGKSYIMNHFFNKNAGFSLGSTIQGKTKGIWVWARPHPLDPSRTLVLLDTEGLLNVEKGDTTHDMRIFSLAILLSECFVYNAVGTLDDLILQELNLVTKLTKHIKIRGGEEDGNEFSRYFPSLFFLLRDFFLEMKINENDITPDEYLEHALSSRRGFSKQVHEYNAARECIRNYFPKRRCFTLCKPVQNNDMLKMLDKIDEKDINPKFLQEAKAATDAILKKATPMAVDGSIINGTRFLYLAKHYVKSINNGEVPCISNAVDLLTANECQKYLEEALGLFQKLMQEKLGGQLPVESDALLQCQKEAHRAAVAWYHKGALSDKDGKYQEKLESQLEEFNQSYISKNNSASKQKCEEILQRCFKVITTKVRAGEYFSKRGTYQSYKQDKETAVRAYNGIPRKGPLAEECLHVFLDSKNGEEETIITGNKALFDKDKEIAKEKEEKLRQEQNAKEAQARNEQLEKYLLHKKDEYKSTIEKMENDFHHMQAKASKEMAEEIRRKEAKIKHLFQESQKEQATEFKKIFDDLKAQNERQQAKMMGPQGKHVKVKPGGTTSLMLACQEGNPDAVSLPLELGADRQKIDTSGYTDKITGESTDFEEHPVKKQGLHTNEETKTVTAENQAGPSQANQQVNAPAIAIPEVDLADLDREHHNKLGRGSYGDVYKAHLHGTTVAVKEIVIKSKGKSPITSVITDEIKISATARHPGIAQFIAFADNLKSRLKSLLLVYEFVDGHNLEEIIWNDELHQMYGFKCLPKKYDIVHQFCQALAYLHSQNPHIIHGDFKPANIMVTKYGKVKLCDLGLSKIKKSHTSSVLTTDLVLGTPVYMAPEQLLYNKSSSTKSDVYSFGVTTYEVIFEEQLWECEENDDVDTEVPEVTRLRKKVETEKIPTRLCKQKNHPLYSLIHSCVQFEYRKRPEVKSLLHLLKELCRSG